MKIGRASQGRLRRTGAADDLPHERPHTRRQFLKGLGALGAVAGIGVAIWRSLGDGGGSTAQVPAAGLPATEARSPLDALASQVVSGGPGKDGIPAIDRPKFVPASDARFLRRQDPVFGIVHRGQVRAYPQLVLVWHEIVNDTFNGERLSITYCPLTGSVVGFIGAADDGQPLTFGTTGNLVNSNLLMYDRVTDSEWPQLLGVAIRGKLKGKRLAEIPLVWARWDRWRQAHPDTVVLSPETGYVRAYGDDPYGSYVPLGGYYASGGPFFPVSVESDRLPPKEVVVGMKAGGATLAVPKRTIEAANVLSLELGGTPLLVMWDEALATARVFVRQAEEQTLEFREGESRDATGSSWSPAGVALDGPLARTALPLADFLDVMWFAWYAFYPDTQVVA